MHPFIFRIEFKAEMVNVNENKATLLFRVFLLLLHVSRLAWWCETCYILFTRYKTEWRLFQNHKQRPTNSVSHPILAVVRHIENKTNYAYLELGKNRMIQDCSAHVKCVWSCAILRSREQLPRQVQVYSIYFWEKSMKQLQ